jgi:CRP-like cAMP-binding protein
MRFLRAYIEDKIAIDDGEWSKISTYFTKVTFEKNDEIQSAGEISKTLYYLSSGVARTYTLTTDGKEITLGIHYNDTKNKLNLFMGDYISYLDSSESPIFCVALDDCVVYKADYNKLDTFYESEFKYMKLARKISDSLLVDITKVIRATHRFSAKERYDYIQNLSPLYEEVLTDYQLASMLGITPQSFSRIKKEQKVY